MCQTYLGNFLEAKDDLEFAEKRINQFHNLRGLHIYQQAMLSRALGDWQQAEKQFLQAATEGRNTEQMELAFYAEINASVCLVLQQRLEAAQVLLSRARGIASTPRDHAFWHWRNAFVVLQTNPNAAMQGLQETALTFQGMNLPRETFGCWLLHAEASRKLGLFEEAKQSIQKAVNLANESDDAFGAMELMLLPELKVWLGQLEPVWQEILLPPTRSSTVQTEIIDVFTLGRSEVQINGVKVPLRMKHTVELLVYLLKSPNRTKSQIFLALYPDADPTQASNNFHKAKQILHEVVPNLSIEHDKKRKEYFVQCGVELRCDYLVFQRLLSGNVDINKILDAYKAFLPEADSPWANEEREALAWNVVKIGLETLQQWYDAGEDKKCLSLVSRLLEIEPFNPALSEYLITATLRLEGEVAAKMALHRVNQNFLNEMGEVPKEIRALSQKLLGLN
jgi:tetratricopeptide (TPR) repeat protein